MLEAPWGATDSHHWTLGTSWGTTAIMRQSMFVFCHLVLQTSTFCWLKPKDSGFSRAQMYISEGLRRTLPLCMDPGGPCMVPGGSSQLPIQGSPLRRPGACARDSNAESQPLRLGSSAACRPTMRTWDFSWVCCVNHQS